MEADGQPQQGAGNIAADPIVPASPVRNEAQRFSAGELVADRYRVIRFIAKGGMGEVYEVEDLELRARVALKTVSPARASSPRQIDRFRQEIHLAHKVTHPNVCRVFDLGRHHGAEGDIFFLTMELLPGETLDAYLRHHGTLTYEQAFPMVRQMVSALAAAHHLGIVHRDFKPGNVMVVKEAGQPMVKVTDFGLATNPEFDETVSTSRPEIVGTPEYMAPEQLRGQYSTRTDIYSLAVTIFQMLTGKLPASQLAPFHDLPPEAAKKIARPWQDAVSKCLSTDPGMRFARVEDFWTAVSGETLEGQPSARTRGRRRRLYAGAAFLVLAAASVLMVVGAPSKLFGRLPEQKHIAVLPFNNIGDDAANKAFAEGVADSLTSKLSQLERYQKSFWVVPASDTRNVKSLDQAYRNLNVTLAVTGSVEHTSDGVNLTANVVDPKNHHQLASRSMHVNSANLDEMQQRVWESVADMLDLQVSPEIKRELAQGGTTQPGAYELYEEGMGYLHRYDVDDLGRAIELFNKALARDSQYALAYAGLGDAYATKYSLTKNPEWIAEATRNAGRAVELNDQLVPVRITLARVYQQTGDFDKALVEYQRAIDKDPAAIDAAYSIGVVYELKGRYQQAEEAYKDVIQRRPEYWAGYGGLGDLYYKQGRFREAVQQFQSVIDLAPDNAFGYFSQGAAYIGLGRYEDAISVLKKGLTIAADSTAWTNLGSAYLYVGRYDEAATAMEKATDLSPHNHVLWRNLADSYDQIPSRRADAKQAYRKALATAVAQLRINPNNPEVLSGIALYHAHLGQVQDANMFIRRALEVAPNDADTLFTAALVYEIIGDREKALAAVDHAVKAGYSLEEIEQEPELRALRSDSRYQRWLQQTKKVTGISSRTGKIEEGERHALQTAHPLLFLAATNHFGFPFCRRGHAGKV